MDAGRRIVSLRESKGWSQRELAKRVGLNVSVMNRIELGDRPIKDQELITLSNVLNVSADYILGISVNNQNNNIDIIPPEFDAWVNDPQSNIFFKEFIDSPEERKEALLKVWEILKQQGKI